jgi:hypothetical protein
MHHGRQLTISAAALVLLAVTVVSLGSASAEEAGRRAGNGPIVGEAESYALSVPARDLGPGDSTAAAAPSRINPLADKPNQGRRGTWNRDAVPTDALGASSQSAGSRTPALDLSFNGTANPFACGGCSPPDTNGDVGPNHYIQMVNATKVAIFDKAGNPLAPPFDLGDLWPGGLCSGNDGDPVVLYDEISNRWLLSQFATPKHLCFAISQTASPLGSYHVYTFNVGQFPDYFKVGVFRSAYYVSANESTYTAYAFDRAKMLAGDPTATFVKFTGQTNFLLPADADGTPFPGANAPGLFYTFKDNSFHGGADRVELFRLRPDFVTPANSTLNRIKTFPVAPFTYTVCGFFNLDCARQQGTARRVDVVSEWPMHRLAYRRFPGRQTLVGNFTVGGGNGEVGAAIRWFELRRNTGSPWTLFQEGTQDPPTGNADRFMGSIAMDQEGNIALGYTVTNSAMFPAIRYATRAPGDPPGTLQPETTLQGGGGSQTGSNRWGDYSAMAVDPQTDCQFWYTNEFYNPSSASNWKTRIGAFTVPGCGP